MPTVASFLSRSLLLPRSIPFSSSLSLNFRARFPSSSSSSSLRFGFSKLPPQLPPRLAALVVASSAGAASFDELDATGKPHLRSSKKSILSDLLQEIEPLDINLIQKDVPADTVDAMKRTISGMLGLLPSDQFHVLVEAFWDPLSRLLVSSMMTGYTLRNAEYRLCLERNLDVSENCSEEQKSNAVEQDNPDMQFDKPPTVSEISRRDRFLPTSGDSEKAFMCDNVGIENLGELTPEAQEYILQLKSRLFSAEKELQDLKRKTSAPQMQQFVGEEKKDLLDYLRSLQPDKVAELSEPTCPGVQEAIHSVVHGLLATLSTKMHSKAPPQSENAPGGTLNIGKDDHAELLENTSLQFQPMITLSRDYLARLLFWCMLLGHYLRGLEYRLELMQLLTISGSETATQNDD